MKVLVLAFSLLCVCLGWTQTLATSRSVDWNLAGLRDTSTVNFLEIDMQNYGAVGDGLVPNDSILENVLATHSGSGLIVNFPAGNFLFNNTIVLDSNIVIKGAGAANTVFKMQLGGSGHSFEINGTLQNSDTTSLVQSIFKDSSKAVVANSAIFNAGDWVRIIQNDSDLVTSSWAGKTVGQLVRIKTIENNVLLFESPMRMNFDLNRAPYLVKFNPAKNVGIECLKILRLDDTAPQQSSNIHYNYAVNCWVMGIESENCTFSHIGTYFSSNLYVSKSYFHHGFSYGGDGRAYGIMLQSTSNECLIENNIFEHLRHSMIVQSGANGNVFAYNYSLDPFWESTPSNSAGDMVLHGNYPFANLFEQNICQNIVIDNSHGPNGPNNTFFRNRAEGYGIFFSAANSPDQNIIGNEIPNTNFPYSLVNYTVQGTGHFLYGNNNKGTLLPSGTNVLPEKSFAYNQPAYFLPLTDWAGIGTPNNMGSNSIPAFRRYFGNDRMENACSSSAVGVPELVRTKDGLSVFPNPFGNQLHINHSESLNGITISDGMGRAILHIKKENLKSSIDTLNWQGGIYFLTFERENGSSETKMVIKTDDIH